MQKNEIKPQNQDQQCALQRASVNTTTTSEAAAGVLNRNRSVQGLIKLTRIKHLEQQSLEGFAETLSME